MHAAGVVHGNLKAENVIISQSAARAGESRGDDEPSGPESATRAG